MKTTLLKKILFIFFFIFLTTVSFSQMTAPEDPGGNPEGNDDPLGGGAPISGGTSLLIAIGLIYGGRKIYYLTHPPKLEK